MQFEHEEFGGLCENQYSSINIFFQQYSLISFNTEKLQVTHIVDLNIITHTFDCQAQNDHYSADMETMRISHNYINALRMIARKGNKVTRPQTKQAYKKKINQLNDSIANTKLITSFTTFQPKNYYRMHCTSASIETIQQWHWQAWSCDTNITL